MMRSLLALLAVAAVTLAAACSGGGSGPAPLAISSPPLPTPTPPAGRLYVDHRGTLFEYALPLGPKSRPIRSLTESPGSGLVPQLAVDPAGRIAIGTPQQLRIFKPPIRTLDPRAAKLVITLTPAITEIGPAGADLVDMEYDPNDDLWLLNNLGGEISELRAPISRSSVAAITIGFGVPGTKTAGYALVQARFDVSATLYVYAVQNAAQRANFFKIPFPYAKPPAPLGMDLAQADFVDPSQYLPTNPNPAPLLLGQYNGPPGSPPPGSPPPQPIDDLSQFAEPLNPVQGIFPQVAINSIVGALIADPPRSLVYALDRGDGRLVVYGLPLHAHATPTISLACPAGPADCNGQSEHLFLAP